MRAERHRALSAAHAVGLAAVLTLTVLTSRPSDWQDTELIVGLLAFALISNSLTVRWRGITMTGAFSALILADALTGPGPAVLIALIAMAADALRRHQAVRYMLSSLFTWATFPLVGGLLFRAL